MVITVGGWIGILIGFAIGGTMGVITGALMTDEYWRNKLKKDCSMKDCEKAPYKIEKD